MKVFAAIAVLALIVAVQAVTEEQKKKVQQYGLDCLEETGADKEKVKQLKLGEAPEGVDDKVKCFVKCVFRKSGFFNEEDHFDKDVTVSKLTLDSADDHDTVLSAIEQCKDKEGDDACDRAYKIYRCYQELKHVSLV